MERYDGKTRKDDIRKWTIIISIAVVVILGLSIAFRQFKKATAADYAVVDMCNGLCNEEMQAEIRRIVGDVVGDKNENGKVKVEIKSIMPGHFGGYTDTAAPLFTGDYVLFFMLDPNPWDEDLLVEKINLRGTKLWQMMNTELPLYACILNTKDRDVEEAREIVDAILSEPAEKETQQ